MNNEDKTDLLMPLYDRLWKERAKKHMANMAITECLKWMEMSIEAKDEDTKSFCLKAARDVCNRYVEEMRNNNY